MFHRGASPYLLIPAIVIAAAVIGWAELQVAYWLLRIAGLPDLPGQIWTGMLVYRLLSLLVWLLLNFGIKSFRSHSEIVREFQRSEIRLLGSQVNPHFLFNALTTIMALCKDEEKVALITQSLADYLRFSLSQQDEGRLSHPLGRSWKHWKTTSRWKKSVFRHPPFSPPPVRPPALSTASHRKKFPCSTLNEANSKF
jgi:hypothetical protein